jgi:hypothetical protein
MLVRTLEFKDVVRQMAVDPTFESFKKFDKKIQQMILSEPFWTHINDAVSLMQPVYLFLRHVDGNAHMGEVFEKIREMGQAILEAPTNDAAQAHQLYLERLEGSNKKVPFHSAVHTAAMLLSPKNWNINFQDKYEQQYAGMRREFLQVLEKVSKSQRDAACALLQYDNEFRNKTAGIFQEPLVQAAAAIADPVIWWDSNGCEISELQYVSKRVLGLTCSNSAAERNWSLHKFLHRKERNRLGFDLQKKLVTVNSNLKLKTKLEAKTPTQYFTEEEFSDGSISEKEVVDADSDA